MTDVPDIVDYPDILSTSEYSSIFNNVYGYVIEPYALEGYSVYCGLKDGNFIIRAADFKSKDIDLSSMPDGLKKILINGDKFGMMMKISKIQEFLLYFSGKNDPILVDIMLSANKFVGPGLLRDLFGKVVNTQKIIEITTFNDEMVNKNKGKYFKPSSFKFINKDNIIMPVYGKIT